MLVEHRSTLVNLLAMVEGSSGEAAADEARRAVEAIRAGLVPVDAAEAAAHGLDPESVAHADRLTTALVTGLVLLQPFLGEEERELMIELVTRTAARAIRAD